MKNDLISVMQRSGLALMQKNADRYVAQCPFHTDHNPSLVVTPSKQLWNCFGCPAGGNVVEFVRRRYGLASRAEAEAQLRRWELELGSAEGTTE